METSLLPSLLMKGAQIQGMEENLLLEAGKDCIGIILPLLKEERELLQGGAGLQVNSLF